MDAMTDDLGNLMQAISDAGIDTNSVVFVAGPKEAVTMKNLGRRPVRLSDTVRQFAQGQRRRVRGRRARYRLPGRSIDRDVEPGCAAFRGFRSAADPDRKPDALGVPAGLDRGQGARSRRLGRRGWRCPDRARCQLVIYAASVNCRTLTRRRPMALRAATRS
jgi:hypothetical protein